MPQKGFYTQGLVILLRDEVSLQDLEAALSGFDVLKRVSSSTPWPFSGPSLIVSYRPEVNGLIAVDIVGQPWPDKMGDPKSEMEVFGAWSMGHFGPFAYPGGLERAKQQSWGWPEAAAKVKEHRAFLRVRVSYVFDTSREALLMPTDYAALPELLFVSEVAAALLAVPGALCYFNPNGERLLSVSAVREILSRGKAEGLIPLELWSNTRLFNLGGSPKWSLMDTVGMDQLDVPDHEACFSSGAYAPEEVENFLCNAALYVHDKGPVIKDGDTMDGPGGIRWQGTSFENGLTDPPRRVIRWLPLDRRPRPKGLPGKG